MGPSYRRRRRTNQILSSLLNAELQHSSFTFSLTSIHCQRFVGNSNSGMFTDCRTSLVLFEVALFS